MDGNLVKFPVGKLHFAHITYNPSLCQKSGQWPNFSGQTASNIHEKSLPVCLCLQKPIRNRKANVWLEMSLLLFSCVSKLDVLAEELIGKRYSHCDSLAYPDQKILGGQKIWGVQNV